MIKRSLRLCLVVAIAFIALACTSPFDEVFNVRSSVQILNNSTHDARISIAGLDITVSAGAHGALDVVATIRGRPYFACPFYISEVGVPLIKRGDIVIQDGRAYSITILYDAFSCEHIFLVVDEGAV